MPPPAPTPPRSTAPTFFRTVWLLLRLAQTRAKGRSEHQRKLLTNRNRRQSTNWKSLFFPVMLLFSSLLHGVHAYCTVWVVELAWEAELQAQGLLVVEERVWVQLRDHDPGESGRRKIPSGSPSLKQWLATEAGRFGRSEAQEAALQKKLETQFALHGVDGFVSRGDFFALPLAEKLSSVRGLPQLSGCLMLIAWFFAAALQGEGVELDTQRRRHPMWEWLLSHPVSPGAVFFAEMLAPLWANPYLISAPVFWASLLGYSQPSTALGLAQGLLVGLLFAVAASCLNKAGEVVAILRLPLRHRGGVLGLMSWLGLTAQFVPALPLLFPDMVLWGLTHLQPWSRQVEFPLLGWMLGGLPGVWSAAFAPAVAVIVSGMTVAFAVVTCANASNHGLVAPSEVVPERNPFAVKPWGRWWRRDPLYHKEIVWLVRDRGALTQAVLIPLSVAGIQLFNLRTLLETGGAEQWSQLCAAAVFFGAYFLVVLGPRSLLSEGSALWISLTWPRGLESLLAAKARFWSSLVNLPVGLTLLVGAVLHPSSAWKFALVGVGFGVFGRSLALKAVTLVQAPSASGGVEQAPWSRRMATGLGTGTFVIGIASQQWQLAVAGVVYSWATAGAMWQNFRARLPFLLDPWSERLPRPPTTMHAMVAILLTTDAFAVVSLVAVAIAGEQWSLRIRALCYSVVGILSWAFARDWFSARGVSDREIWQWRADAPATRRQVWTAVLTAVVAGALLGQYARLYLLLLEVWWPGSEAFVTRAGGLLSEFSGERIAAAVLTVICAPLAEEYFFRGLLYRALERQYGGRRALLGSAIFFAIYHPAVAWLPVGALGVLAAVLFRKGRSLWPAVAAHAAYNLTVLL